MTSVTRPSGSMRMKPLGMKSRAGDAPGANAAPIRAGRLKLTSRPPPAAAPALRKVRRDRVRTAVEINPPDGFPQQDGARVVRHLPGDEPRRAIGRTAPGRRREPQGPDRRRGGGSISSRIAPTTVRT